MLHALLMCRQSGVLVKPAGPYFGGQRSLRPIHFSPVCGPDPVAERQAYIDPAEAEASLAHEWQQPDELAVRISDDYCLHLPTERPGEHAMPRCSVIEGYTVEGKQLLVNRRGDRRKQINVV